MVVWYDNIPVLSWLVLRGRCRHCGQPISIQYPIIEAMVAAMWGAAMWHYGAPLAAATAAVFGTLLLGIAITDARHYIIPDEFSVGGLVLGLGLSAFGGVPSIVTAVLGAAAGFGLLYGVAWLGAKVFGKEAMGGGDIKMMAMVGAFVGWKGVLLTVFGGALLGTAVFLPLIALRRGKEAPLVPFGIFLAAAAALVFLFGQVVVDWYLGVMGLT
jgi:leader peptidase (prepilin peptidase)/N-methyltransferase